MSNAEKIVSLTKYAQNLKDRLARGKYPKRDNSVFLKLDLQKTERKIEKLKLDTTSPAAQEKK